MMQYAFFTLAGLAATAVASQQSDRDQVLNGCEMMSTHCMAQPASDARDCELVFRQCMTGSPSGMPIIRKAAASGTAVADDSAVWVTQTVTAYKTFCPSSTSFIHSGKVHTATASEWVTVTACPSKCTISNIAGAIPTVVPVNSPVPYLNGTAPAQPGVPSGKAGSPVGQISDGQIQATAPAGVAPSYSASTAVGPPASQSSSISQAPASSAAKSSPAASGSPLPISQISDGQIQATGAVSRPASPAPTQSSSQGPGPVSQIPDGQLQPATAASAPPAGSSAPIASNKPAETAAAVQFGISAAAVVLAFALCL